MRVRPHGQVTSCGTASRWAVAAGWANHTITVDLPPVTRVTQVTFGDVLANAAEGFRLRHDCLATAAIASATA